MPQVEKITIENVLQPGKTYRVDAAKYQAARDAYLKAAPKGEPGQTVAEIHAALRQHLPEDLFPGGEKAGWWAKAVQLDLEAKGLLKRTDTKPLRLYRLG